MVIQSAPAPSPRPPTNDGCSKQADARLFLAIPQSVYDYYFVRPTTKRIIQAHNILLIVVDLDREEIVK